MVRAQITGAIRRHQHVMLIGQIGDRLAAGRRECVERKPHTVIENHAPAGLQLLARDVADIVIRLDFDLVAFAVAGENSALVIELLCPNLGSPRNRNAPLRAITSLRLNDADGNCFGRYGRRKRGCGDSQPRYSRYQRQPSPPNFLKRHSQISFRYIDPAVVIIAPSHTLPEFNALSALIKEPDLFQEY